MKRVDKNLIDSFEKLIKTVEEKNLDVVEYMKKNIALQDKIRQNKTELDKTTRVKACIKTYLHAKMLHKLKTQFWSIGLYTLDMEYSRRKKTEIPGIKEGIFKSILEIFISLLTRDICTAEKVSQTKTYFEMFYLLQEAYKMVFMNIGNNYELSKSEKKFGLSEMEKINQNMKNLKSQYNNICYVTKVTYVCELEILLNANIEIEGQMEKDLLSCLDFLKRK
ncbi:hypothetical protein EDEG_01967 [Edhazardia aedis USNM 41457]|uniref:Uncharacterized protein n=1 Tax=Edhazardia aedis (strain USNM 41457) TaxID=1003232 RepID=J9D895_EDHAE|nr:hypothetical protein EDEG_01967 [Edhazardia aedis USNM 41457]|eukprot:EJW03729.1 hypothetical protein EDEG_01967 [Edhazardia aedis USNM 41457]